MSLNIVLVEPLIPQNTGTIARMTAATNTKLHLIEPLGFKLTDKYLKRAGLDYWPEVNYITYENWDEFIIKNDISSDNIWFFSTHAKKYYIDVSYAFEDYLVFGNESYGLSKFYHENYRDRMLKLPMLNKNVRSLNLSNACSIVAYEAMRQLKLY